MHKSASVYLAASDGGCQDVAQLTLADGFVIVKENYINALKESLGYGAAQHILLMQKVNAVVMAYNDGSPIPAPPDAMHLAMCALEEFISQKQENQS